MRSRIRGTGDAFREGRILAIAFRHGCDCSAVIGRHSAHHNPDSNKAALDIGAHGRQRLNRAGEQRPLVGPCMVPIRNTYAWFIS